MPPRPLRPRCPLRPLLCPLLLLLSLTAAAGAQKQSVKPGINASFLDPDVDQFVERFEREGRDVYDRRHEIVAACQIAPGMHVADVGAGTGLFTLLLAKAVGPEGKVYAVDIAKKFIDHIAALCQQKGITNVTGIVCDQDDVRLPRHSVDLVFICDTYHHFEFPQKTMRSIHEALRPGGRLVLVEFRRIEGRSSDWVLEHVRAGQETFAREITDAGFRQIDEKPDLLRDSYLLIFERTE